MFFIILSGTIRPSSSLHTITVSYHVIRRLQNFHITWTDERSHTNNNLDQTVSFSSLVFWLHSVFCLWNHIPKIENKNL